MASATDRPWRRRGGTTLAKAGNRVGRQHGEQRTIPAQGSVGASGMQLERMVTGMAWRQLVSSIAFG